jgi:glucokinase
MMCACLVKYRSGKQSIFKKIKYPEMKLIGIDLGGTNVKAVCITDQGEIMKKQLVSIPNGDWKKAVKVAYDSVKENDATVKVGLAAPGLPDERNQQINHMPGRLPGLEGFNWSHYLNCPVKVLNDAHAALLAEVNFGNAKGWKNVVMLTLGTGVGGALLINGELYQGVMQRAGSIGDISLDATSTEIGFLRVPGTLEDAIGNESVSRRSNNRFHNTRELTEAYARGDAEATRIWLLSVKKLAVALCSLINVLAPERIVLGGGIVQSNERLFKPLFEFMDQYEWRPSGHATPVVKAHFDDYAGAIGAACFAWRGIKGN